MARTLYLKAIDAIQHQGLRLCLGAFRTSQIDSFYVEANKPPHNLRRLKLTLQYVVKLKANIDNQAYDCVFNPQYENLNDKNKKYIKSILIQMHINGSNIPSDIIKTVSHSKIPPWKLL